MWSVAGRCGVLMAARMSQCRRRAAQLWRLVRSCFVALAIHRSEHPPWRVLSLAGDLDVAGAPALRQEVVTAVAGGSRQLVLDLSRLDFIDSFGLGVVVGSLKRTRQRGGDVRLVCPVPRIRRVFEMCCLDRVMALNATVAEALNDPAPPVGLQSTSASHRVS